MAEIKSTLEKVMERVAAMEKAATVDIRSEEKIKDGMRLGADYLKGNDAALDSVEVEGLAGDAALLRQGIVRVFLRNIVMPRDENMEATERAMQGVLQIAGNAGDLKSSLGEMKMILEHYQKQKIDLRQQLESAMRQQLEQAVAQQAGQAETVFKIDPTRHPKFQEEWQRIMDGLNEQYGSVLEQHKAIIAQRLA